MGKPILHQFVVGASPGDAITDHALLLRRWLREDGFNSHIFAESIAPGLEGNIKSYLAYRPDRKGAVVILHHSIGSDVVDYLLSLDVRVVLIYHNVTPASFFESSDPALAAQLARGRDQLLSLRSRTLLGLGVSKYDENELCQAGFASTGVLPIVLDEEAYNFKPNPRLLERYQDSGPNLLFVGRLVPNKCQDDLIKIMYYLKRIVPVARLFLVGSPWLPAYADWLQELAVELEVSGRVIFTGHVSQRDLVTYYQLADLYVSMSEHEGFGKPFIEAMYFGIPVVAYAAAAVPGTLGGSCVLIHAKKYVALSELLSILLENDALRPRIILKQREKVKQFLGPQVKQIYHQYLTEIKRESG